MFVLIDMEWVMLSASNFSVTQLAALRVDKKWESTEQFHSLVTPTNKHFHLWNHVAFAGATKDEFLAAPSATDVFRDFQQWLRPDDILLWWRQESSVNFSIMLKRLFKRQLNNECHFVQPLFECFIEDGIDTHGNPYRLAQLRGLQPLFPEHDSMNDVTMLRLLLQRVNFQKKYLYTPIPEQGQIIAELSPMPYHIDPKTKRAHLKGCTELPNKRKIIGCQTLNAAYKRDYKPCACCKTAWREFLRTRNQEILSKTQYNYIFLLNSRVFHKPSCSTIREASTLPQGAIHYSTCINAHRIPCKLCKPSLKDQLIEVKSNSLPKETLLPNVPVTKRSMTPSEKRSVKRHNQASKERASLDLSAMTSQQREDAITLTATRFAFWAVQGYESFHVRNCAKIKGLEGLRGFSRYNEAIHAGFKPCRLCKPTQRSDVVASIPIYNQERANESVTEMIKQCESYGFTCEFDDRTLTIITPIARWSFDPWRQPYQLMHQHTEASPQGKSEKHRQHRLLLSLKDVVSYIVKHDLGK